MVLYIILKSYEGLLNSIRFIKKIRFVCRTQKWGKN